MSKNKFFAAFLVFTSILTAFSGPAIVRIALAQPQEPPTVSSEGEYPPIQSLPETQPSVYESGPATDDVITDGALPAQVDPPSYPAQDFGIVSDGWIGSLPHGFQAESPQSGTGIQSVVLWDNGPVITHPGGGYNGADASRLQTDLGMNTLGFGNQFAYGNHMADNFDVTDADGWQIENITFYSYQTGTYADPPISTITGVYLQIWDGSPDNAASSVIFGDLVTNRLIETYWTGIYRDSGTTPMVANRPIMTAVADVNISLPQGTYWLDWMIDGSGTSGPWAPPITILGQTTTGNALQYTTSGGTWAPANDSGTLTQQGMPFVIEGTVFDWLWNQSLSTSATEGWVDQEFTDLPTYSSFLSDDFMVDKVWNIDTIYIPGRGWNGFSSLMNATSLHWMIFADNGGVPAGDPTGTGAPPLWQLTLPPDDPRVSITPGTGGFPSNTLLNLSVPIELSRGHYWIMFYPTMPFTPYGQFGLQGSDTSNGEVAKFINPGGGFGFGTNWQDWNILGAASHDFAFSLNGTKTGNWKSIDSINSLGRSRPAAAAVNGKIYLFGGEISGGRADTVERYDPSTNSWTTLGGVMPYPASNICAAVIGTDIYIPGGYSVSSISLDTLQVYHTTSGTWSTITTDPLPLGLHGSGCATLNGKLYVFGGSNSTTYQSGAYVYDPTAPAGSRWTTLASMEYARSYLAGVAVNGKIYAIGGRNSSIVDLNLVEAFNPADGLWHAVTHMKEPRAGVGVYAVGNTIYTCGGGWYSYLDSCESYDTTQGYSGTWQSHPSIMIEGRRTFAYANIGPVLYAIAGWRGTYLQTAERWSFESFLPLTIK